MSDRNDTALREAWTSPSGFPGWLSVVNNRPLGVRFMVTAFTFFLIGGVMALLMRIQLAVSENSFLGPEWYNRLFTMHGSTMMYLFSVPFLEGLALYVLPLLIGSRDVAYPRLTAFGYWTYLFGGLLFYASFLFGKVPDAGWFAYTPLSSSDYSGLGLDFWAVGLSLVEISGIVAAVEMIVTILKLRAPGMSLNRLPMFGWAMLAAGLMSLFAFTTLLVGTLMLELDRTAGTQFFNSRHGGTSLLWQHLFWFFGHPEVYIIFLPATGIVSMVVGTFARRLVGYTYIAVAILVTGFVSFGLWVHHMYTTGLPELSLGFFAAASLMIALASGVQVFAWIASLWGQRPALRSPLMFVLGFVFIFVLGGMTGVMVAIVPFDWQVHDTYFVVAHFHYVLIGGAVFPILAGVYYWLPKITGRMLLPWLGQLNFWLSFVGFNLTFFPMHIIGFLGMPRRVYTYSPGLGLDGYNLLATVGAFVLATGFAVLLIDVCYSLWHGKPAGNNPWGGVTLEWTVASPPPAYGFWELPIVNQRLPGETTPETPEGPASLARKPADQSPAQRAGSAQRANPAQRAVAALRGQPTQWRATLNSDVLTAAPQSIQYLPGPSYYPLLVAVGLVIALVAVLAKVYLVGLVGLAIAGLAIGGWLWPETQRIEQLRDSPLVADAGLPTLVSGRQSLGWWGMVCLLAILGTGLLAMLYAYFYIRLYSPQWPQEGLPRPDWLPFGIAYGLLLLTAPALAWAGHAYRHQRSNQIQFALTTVVLLTAAFLATSLHALVQYGVSPQQTAYGSLVALLSAYPWLLALVGLALVGAAQRQLWREAAVDDPFAASQLQIVSLYGYFVIVAGVLVFLTLVVPL